MDILSEIKKFRKENRNGASTTHALDLEAYNQAIGVLHNHFYSFSVTLHKTGRYKGKFTVVIPR